MRTRIRPRVESLEGRALLTAGALDTTFGGTGYVLSQIGSDPGNSSRAVAVQPNLDVVVVGMVVYPTGGAHSAVERFTPGGALDPSFGRGGVVNLPFTTSIAGDVPYGVALQANGDIVVIASVITTANIRGISTITGHYWGAARLLPGGAPDPAFGTSGDGMVLIMKSTNSSSIPESVAFQTNGQIVVEGQFNGNQLALARLNADGSLDTTFGSGGSVVNPTVIPTFLNKGTQAGMAVDASGRIVVTGSVGQIPSSRMAVLRYNANGTPDTTFGTGGMTTALPAGFSYTIGDSLAIQSTGAVVVDGTGVPTSPTAPTRPLILARFTPSGSLDTSFGIGGYFVENRLAVTQWSSVSVQGNDEIVALARVPLGPPSPSMVVTRVLADGSATDTSFGTNGLTALSLPNTYGDAPGGVVIAPDGKIVVTGDHLPNTGPSFFAVARFLGDSPPAAHLTIRPGAPATVPATVTEPTLIPLVLDDPLFLDSLAIGKRHHA